MQRKLNFRTNKDEIVDLTHDVKSFVKKFKKKEGLVNIFAPHATGVLIIGEHEPNLDKDYRNLMKKLIPEGVWQHDTIDDNAHAHLRSAIFGASLNVPIMNGELALGTWQRIMFIETHGPRSRHIILTSVKSD